MARAAQPNAIRVDKDNYMVCNTGEVLEYSHKASRVQNAKSLRKTLSNLRDVINTNVTNPQNCLWVTLTYRENMQDSTTLYEDFRRFNQRISYYFLDSSNHAKAEYIAVAEPQGRGAWHMHCLYIFPHKAPYVVNGKLAEIWGKGFVTVTRLKKDVDNVGLYLSAYLGDMPVEDAFQAGIRKGDIIKEVEVTDCHGAKRKKSIIKGARLKLYPTGMRLYRCSKGIKKPLVTEMTEAEAQKLIGNAPLTFEKTIQLVDENGKVLNTISYRQYNRAKGVAADGKAT